MSEKQYDVIIIGGGAAGLMAAGKSAEQGKKTLLLEKMNRPGRKLAITGKGRCNLTNTCSLQEFISEVKPNGKFLRSAFSEFFSDDLIDFFNSIGVKTVLERGNRVFPENGKAPEVVKALVNWCKKQNVEIRNDFKVSSIITKDDVVAGVAGKYKDQEKTFYAPKVILATGGASYPATGSTGDGYEIAKQLGHTINKIQPSLVPLIISGNYPKLLNGVELRNVKASLWVNDKKATEGFGEMSFTEFGITGPIILTISRTAVEALMQKSKVQIKIDLKPALDDKKLDNRLIRDLDSRGKEKFGSILGGLLPKKLIPVCIQDTGIEYGILGNQISAKQRKKLRLWLKEFTLDVIGHRPFSKAIITVGGVSTNEVNQKTMESKKIQGLYFAGEILDLDAPTGGYNLQIAFSTGWLAGN